jgi:hypothetical protein
MQMCATFLWGSMCERFLKLIPNSETRFLARKHPNAFILLFFIADRARRENGDPDGLTIGQCHLGDHKEFGLTEKEYRTAKKILVQRSLIKIIETCRTRKKNDHSLYFNLQNCKNRATERATRTTTVGTLVELIGSTAYDINPDSSNQQKGDRKGDRGATEGRPKGDEQEGIRRNKKEKNKELPLTPLFSISSKIKFRELVELTQDEYNSLLAKNGLEFLNLMLDTLDAYKGSSGKKYSSDFHTMKQGGWVISRVKRDLENQQKTPKDEKNFRPAPGRTPPGNTPGSPTKFQASRVLRSGEEPAAERQVDTGSVNE